MATINPYSYEFIGREGALDAFHSLRSLRAQRNALYLEAGGGLGKTRVLREYIEQCKQQRRPWHSHPDGNEIDPIIDFYDFQNRTIAGLRRSIVERVGSEYFQEFRRKDTELHEAEAALKAGDTSAHPKVLALRLEVGELFFQNFSRALREIKNYTVLFFDTFEVVYNRRVGRWFLEEFLPSPATSLCLIVFAGRPRPFESPKNVYRYELKPFTNEEAAAYFKEKWGITAGEPEFAIIAASEGKPLLLDLTAHYTRLLNGRIGQGDGQSRQDLERMLVHQFLNQGELLYEVIQDMAYLKRRYNKDIYERQKYTDQGLATYEALGKQLRQFPFIKHRTGGDSYTLHDVFQEMIEEHGGRNWQEEVADALYEDIVHDWYNQAIETTSEDVERNLLRAEQLAYILERDREEGIAHYQAYFEEIRRSLSFDFNDLLWGELAEHLGNDVKAYELTRSQANWLFNNSRFTDAAPLFQQTTGLDFKQVADVALIRGDMMRLGHCYLNTGGVKQAAQIWGQGVRVCRQNNDTSGIALYEFNLGHVHARTGRWDDALVSYQSAIDHAQKAKARDVVADALFASARLRAQQGEYRRAIGELKRGLRLVEITETGRANQAQAFVLAGDIYRYFGDFEAAKEYYLQANDLFASVGSEWHAWRVRADAGLGATYHLTGIRRWEDWNDIAGDAAHQKEAFQFLNQALNLVREYNIGSHLMLVLDRMADIYAEANKLKTLADSTGATQIVNQLEEMLDGLELVEELGWTYALRESNKPFSSLDLLGKAQRLFEVAFLQAERMQSPHQVLDSLIGAARVAQRRVRKSDIEHYTTLVDTLSGLDDPNQETMFLRLLDVLLAHLSFVDNPELAIDRYELALTELAEVGGFGWLQAQRELPEVANRLRTLDTTTARQVYQRLSDGWQNYPELQTFVNGLQDLM